MPKKYKSTFRTAAGEPFPPLHVNFKETPKGSGNWRAYWRGPGFADLPRGEATMPGVRLLVLRTNVVKVEQAFWDKYNHLRYGRPLPSGEPVVEKGCLLAGSWDALILHFKRHSRQYLEKQSADTRNGYETYFRLIHEAIGEKLVAKTTKTHLEQLIAIKRTDKNGAAKQLRTLLSMLCEHAVDLEWIAGNPVRRIEKPKSRNKEGLHTLSEEQVNVLRLTYTDCASYERRLLEIGVAWGPRASDLAQLGWKNIVNGKIVFTPKKTKESTGAVVKLPVAGEHLLAVLEHCPKDERFFFQAPPRGGVWKHKKAPVNLHPKGWDYKRLRETFERMCLTAGIWSAEREAKEGRDEKPTPHSMRKYFATRCANASANPQDIADALGDTLECAMIYWRKRNKEAGAERAFLAALAA